MLQHITDLSNTAAEFGSRQLKGKVLRKFGTSAEIRQKLEHLTHDKSLSYALTPFGSCFLYLSINYIFVIILYLTKLKGIIY